MAADNATGGQFNFAGNATNTNPQITVSCCSGGTPPTAVGTYTSTTSYTSNIHAPRAGFLSPVGGPGLLGLGSGTQYASATAVLSTNTLISGNACLSVNPQDNTQTGITFVNDNGGGKAGGVTAANCSIIVNCGNGNTAFNPPNSSSSDISGQNIIVAAATGCTPGYSSHLYTNAYAGNSSNCNACGVLTTPAVAADPLAAMGNALGDSGTAAWQAACSAAGVTSSSTGDASVNLYTSSLSVFSSHQYTYNSITYSINPNTFCVSSGYTGSYLTTSSAYFFPAGLNISAKQNVTFGPGIYYFGGAGISAAGGNVVTSTGTTLVFVGNATILMTGNGQGGYKMTLVAPDASLGSTCISPTTYNNGSWPGTNDSTLDGTSGGGICGIAMYEGRNDTAAMTLSGDVLSSVIGIIYAPNAAATLSGSGGFQAGTYGTGTLNGQTGTFVIMVSHVTLNGGGSLTLNINANDSAGTTANQTTTTVTTTPPVLTN